MSHKRSWTGCCAAVAMLCLILDGKTALGGALAGIELCGKVVIPSLFPFFVFSRLLTSTLAGIRLPGLSILCRLFGVPKGSESILLAGFLGGYPVGAQSISAAWQQGNLSKSDAQIMLAFCNLAGPAFLFGMVRSLFPDGWMVWVLWGIQLVSAYLVSLHFPDIQGSLQTECSASPSLSAAMSSAVSTMGAVCGWVVIFRTFIAFLERWFLWALPQNFQVLVIGLLELSNGCSYLSHISDITVRFLFCSVFLSFGGLCVSMQTVSVASGLSVRNYFCGKILQSIYSLILSAAIVLPAGRPVCLLLLFPFLRRFQKKSSIPEPVVV